LRGSIGVIVAALVIRYTGWTWVDSLVAVGIGLWVLPRTWLLLKESLNILLEGVPQGVDPDAVSAAIRQTPGVMDIHDLHIWALSSGKTSLSVHVLHLAEVSGQEIVLALRPTLRDQFDIQHITVQCETSPCPDASDNSHWTEPQTGLAERAKAAASASRPTLRP